MPNALAGCHAKLNRANEHLDSLQTEVRGYPISVEILPEHDPQRGELILRVTRVPEFPIRWGTLIGDALHNWRSALDYLAHELIKLDDGKYWSHSQFPIADEIENLAKSWRFQGTMERLSPEHRALMEFFQPYTSTWDPKQDTLVWLRFLSDLDKHRVIIGTFMASDFFRTIRTTPIKNWIPGKWHYELVGVPLYPGAELLRIEGRPVGPDAQVKVDLDFAPYVTLPGGPRLEKVLGRIRARVTEVVEAFEPWFE
jgi:hypothetical protein